MRHQLEAIATSARCCSGPALSQFAGRCGIDASYLELRGQCLLADGSRSLPGHCFVAQMDRRETDDLPRVHVPGRDRRLQSNQRRLASAPPSGADQLFDQLSGGFCERGSCAHECLRMPKGLWIGLWASNSSSVLATTWNRGRPWSSARTMVTEPSNSVGPPADVTAVISTIRVQSPRSHRLPRERISRLGNPMTCMPIVYTSSCPRIIEANAKLIASGPASSVKSSQSSPPWASALLSMNTPARRRRPHCSDGSRRLASVIPVKRRRLQRADPNESVLRRSDIPS